VADKALALRVVSPVTVVFEGEVVAVTLPAWDGRVGILPGHAPFVALLGGGILEADLPGGGVQRVFLVRGVVKVEDDRVTVLTEYAGDGPPEGWDASQAWLDPEEFEGNTASGSAGG